MPKVSIIVPVYKAEPYLHSCVDSILSQSFSDFEVFLVDDGSPDGCGAICDDYAKKDPRVRVLHQENQGQAAARNHALPLCQGEWLCFVDSDDVIHPDMVRLLYQAAQHSGAGISLCAFVESPQMPEDFLRPRREDYEVLPVREETLVALYDREEYPAWVACTKLVRRELVESYPFREGRIYEDNEAVCRWVWGAGSLARLPEDLYYYRTNPISTTQKQYSLKKLDYLWALDSIIRFYHSQGCSQLAGRFCQRYAREAADQTFKVRNEMDRPDVLKQIRRTTKALLKDGIPFSKEQKEVLLDAFYPKLIRYYWPVEGAVRTLGEKGVSGLVRKVREQLRKGDTV